MSKYDWSNIPKEYKFAATDDLGDKNVSWAYKTKPIFDGYLWCDSHDLIHIGTNIYTGDCSKSLEERPNE